MMRISDADRDALDVMLAMRVDGLAIDVAAYGDLRVILVSGDLDGSTRYMLRAVLGDVWLCAPGRIVLSLAGCTSCDSRSVVAVISLRQRAGRRLHVVLPTANDARRVFTSSGITEGTCRARAAAFEPFLSREPRE